MSGKPTVISTFAGCGGSSLGYHMAGFKELLALDFDENARDTFTANFKETPFWLRDICTVTGQEILDFCGIKKGDLDVFDGSPPCQGFSTAGKRNVNDSRNTLFNHFIRLINELQPKVFLMENVSGQVKGTMKGYFKEIITELKSTGYSVKCSLMNSMFFNVPQSRQRLIYIGVRSDLKKEPSFPKPKTVKPITVMEALKNCPDDEQKLVYTNKDAYLIPLIKQGTNMSKVHPKGWGFNLGRVHWFKPCPTITKTFRQSQTGLLHPKEDRFLTISELKRLASFPDEFKFVGKFEEQWARIGNAVMPKFMEAIAEHIKTEILEV